MRAYRYIDAMHVANVSLWLENGPEREVFYVHTNVFVVSHEVPLIFRPFSPFPVRSTKFLRSPVFTNSNTYSTGVGAINKRL